MSFLLADNYCADNSASADEQQGNPQSKVACIAGLGSLRQLCRYGVGFFDFLGAVLVAEILITAFAVPILDIAIAVLGRRLGGDILEVGVVLRRLLPRRSVNNAVQ